MCSKQILIGRFCFGSGTESANLSAAVAAAAPATAAAVAVAAIVVYTTAGVFMRIVCTPVLHPFSSYIVLSLTLSGVKRLVWVI